MPTFFTLVTFEANATVSFKAEDADDAKRILNEAMDNEGGLYGEPEIVEWFEDTAVPKWFDEEQLED